MDTNVTAWTQNNAWSEQDFNFSTRGDQPTLAKGGPGCDFLLNAWNVNGKMKKQLQAKTNELSLCTRLKLTQLLEAGIGDVT
jgi:hypothetical protein